jgi:hypothetical protein
MYMKRLGFLLVVASVMMIMGCNGGTVVDDGDVVDDDVVVEDDVAPLDDEGAKAALQAKHPDWDVSAMIVTVHESDEEFATGGVGGEGGGGMFFAANTEDGWVIAWDGNGSIGCADVDPYGFPADMIPECYDYDTDTLVER